MTASSAAMRTWKPLGVIAFVVFAACSGNAPSATQTPMPSVTSSIDFKAQASTVVEDLAAGKFVPVEARFDATMKAHGSADALAANWVLFQKAYGGYRSHGTPMQVLVGATTVERVPIRTATGTAEVRVSYHPDGTIAGLFFLRAGAPPP